MKERSLVMMVGDVWCLACFVVVVKPECGEEALFDDESFLPTCDGGEGSMMMLMIMIRCVCASWCYFFFG